MTRKYFTYIAPILLAVTFFADGQLSTFANNMIPSTWVVTSHLVLIVGLFCANHLPQGYSIFLFTLVGLLQDIYYLRVIGIATTLLPLVIYLMYYFYQSVRFTWWGNLMILLVTVFVLDFSGFLLARAFHLTNLSVFIFGFNDLLPSLIANSLLLLIFEPIGVALFGITKKT